MQTLGTVCLYISLFVYHTYFHFAVGANQNYSSPRDGQIVLTIVVVLPILLTIWYMQKRFALDATGSVARPSRRTLVEVLFLVAFNSAPRLAGAEVWQQSRLVTLFIAISSCYVGVIVYCLYFAYAPRRGRGVWFGVSMMPGLFSKPLFEWLVAPIIPETFHLAYTFMTFVSLLLLPSVLGALLFAVPERQTAAQEPSASNAEKSAVRVGLICFIVFFMNGLLYDQLFVHYTISATENKPAPLYFFAVLFCPVVDWLSDKDAAKWFPRILIIVAGIWLVAPMVAGILGSSGLFFTIGTLATGGLFLLFISSTVILSQMAASSQNWALIVCAPFLCRLAVVPGIGISRYINVETLVLISIGAAGLLYHLANRLFFIRRYSSPAADAPPSLAPVTTGAEEAAPESPGEANAANSVLEVAPDAVATTDALFDRHNLTSREREVAEFLVRGKTTQDIATALGISERTVHYHIQNILRKFDVPNRMAFVVKFMRGDNNDTHPSLEMGS